MSPEGKIVAGPTAAPQRPARLHFVKHCIIGRVEMLDLSGWLTFFQYLAAVFGAFVVALWLGLIFWTYRDIRSRTPDRLIHALAALLAAVMGPLGYLIYLILRPLNTLEDAYQRTLEEEALLAEIEEKPVCPGCSTRTQPDWIICPNCHTRLRKACSHCRRLMELPWQVCPFCGTPAPGVRAEVPLEEFRG